MKKIIPYITAALLVATAAGLACAEDITVSGVNIKELVNQTRVGVWIPLQGGATFKTLYTPLVSLHDSAGVEYAVLDVGAAAPGAVTKGYAFAAFGLRLDTMLDRLVNVSGWMKRHVSAVPLPPIEAGAGALLYNNKVRFGVSVAIKF